MTDSLASVSLRARARVSGFDGVPWAEYWRNRPALVVPQAPGFPMRMDPTMGWSRSLDPSETVPSPGWKLVLTGEVVTITSPDGVPWYQGCPLLTRDWRRAATAQRRALLISGPFARIDEFMCAASAGTLGVLLVAVH
jgi:hypothetical protein